MQSFISQTCMRGRTEEDRFLSAQLPEHNNLCVCVCVRLTRPALVPHTEVFAYGGTGVRPKQTTVDKNLTSPPVLTFIQHLLQRDRQIQTDRQHAFIQVHAFHGFHFPCSRFLPSGQKNTQSVILLRHTVLHMCVFIACGFSECASVNHTCVFCQRRRSSKELLPHKSVTHTFISSVWILNTFNTQTQNTALLLIYCATHRVKHMKNFHTFHKKPFYFFNVMYFFKTQKYSTRKKM